MNSVCCIFNFAPHYRTEVYLRMEQELGCDFYFGNRVSTEIKKLDYDLFQCPPKELRYIRIISHFNWLVGSLRLCFQSYQSYILTGEPYCLSSWVILLINRIRGRKSLVWTHGWYGNETRIKKIIKRAYFGLATQVLLYGNYARNLMIKEKFNPAKLHVICNSLAYSQQKRIREWLKPTTIYFDHFRNTRPTLIFVGRLEPRKKLYLLLEAISILSPNNRPNLCIIGDGISLRGLEELASRLHLSNQIWFYGECYDEDTIASLIYNADICVSPGEVGLTAIHAMSYGTPVITHGDFDQQMPEFEAVIPGLTGQFFKRGEVSSLSAVINSWLQKNPKKSEATIKACYNIIDSCYNPNYQMKVLKKILSSIETG